MIGTTNLQLNWPVLNFLLPSLGQREGTKWKHSLSGFWDDLETGEVRYQASRMEGNLPLADVRDELCSKQPAAGRQIELRASIIVTTCFKGVIERSLVKRAGRESSRIFFYH